MRVTNGHVDYDQQWQDEDEVALKEQVYTFMKDRKLIKHKISILLTVYNRPPEMLQATFQGVIGNKEVEDFEVIIIDDNSDLDYKEERALLDSHDINYQWVRVNTLDHAPNTYNLNGYNVSTLGLIPRFQP